MTKHLFRLSALCLFASCLAGSYAAAPTVSNVRASQRSGTNLVDIYYDLTDPDSSGLTVTIAVSTNGGASYNLPATSFTGALGMGIAPGNNKKITWDAGADWNGKFSANVQFRVTADDAATPSGMALVPAGWFTMGDTFTEGITDERPTHFVYVSAFYMDKCEVTKSLWDEVDSWAITHGYSFGRDRFGKANNYPVLMVTWYDVVKWCNARSEKENLTPCYYTDTNLTVVYKTGQVTNPYVNWSASGYRLPTEAEWEKAARGGASGHRFPWSDADTIQHSRANYMSSTNLAYDTSSTRGHHPAFHDVYIEIYTSPAGYFTPNGYGLYDMAGNVWEWCWDWYGLYGSGSETDPRGPTSGSERVDRGGSWNFNAIYCRSALRDHFNPAHRFLSVGFRSARSAGH
jgi:formylglycine-generating enzyme